MAVDSLLEISVEEIPSSYIKPALEQMKTVAEKHLNSVRISYTEVRVYGTPRRLAIMVCSIQEKSEDRVEETVGPIAKMLKDDHGNFTPAAKGFASKFGMVPEKLQVKHTI